MKTAFSRRAFRPSAGEKLQVINEIELEARDTRNLSSARFAEELGILTLHLVYKAGYGSRGCFGVSEID
jgi:hypothetical protein